MNEAFTCEYIMVFSLRLDHVMGYNYLSVICLQVLGGQRFFGILFPVEVVVSL